MRFFKGKVPAAQDEMDTQQERLRKLSGEVLKRYLKELGDEIADPDRLKAVYGAGFADANVRQQAEVVATMATSMLKVPNAAVNMVTADGQDSIANVANGQVQKNQFHLPMSESYCANVIHTGAPMAITNALEHPLVCDTHLAKDGVAISYLGVPVANRDSVIVGTLCVFDTIHRDWTTTDVGMLTQLSMVLTRTLPSVASTS